MDAAGAKESIHVVRAVLVTLLIVIVVITASLWVWCRRNLMFSAAIPIHIENRVADAYFDPRRPLPEPVTHFKLWGDTANPDRESFRRETAAVLAGARDDFERAWRLCQWTRGQCKRMGGDLEQVRDPYQALLGMRAGKGALCGPLAYVLREALVSNGIPARVAMFMREPPFISDGHAVVEAFAGGRWVMFDPTFNIYYTVDGVPASVWRLREAHYYRPWGKIDLVEGTLLPGITSIRRYHLSYASQMNAVLYEYYEHPLATKYGLIRYPYLKLLQSNFVHLVRGDKMHTPDRAALRINNILVQLIYIWLPSAFIACSILLALTFVRGRRQRPSPESP